MIFEFKTKSERTVGKAAWWGKRSSLPVRLRITRTITFTILISIVLTYTASAQTTFVAAQKQDRPLCRAAANLYTSLAAEKKYTVETHGITNFEVFNPELFRKIGLVPSKRIEFRRLADGNKFLVGLYKIALPSHLERQYIAIFGWPVGNQVQNAVVVFRPNVVLTSDKITRANVVAERNDSIIDDPDIEQVLSVAQLRHKQGQVGDEVHGYALYQWKDFRQLLSYYLMDPLHRYVPAILGIVSIALFEYDHAPLFIIDLPVSISRNNDRYGVILFYSLNLPENDYCYIVPAPSILSSMIH